MCMGKTPDDPVMPREKQPAKNPDQVVAGEGERQKDRMRAMSQTILTGSGGALKAPTSKSSILGG